MGEVRYKPGEAVRWLEYGADDLRGSAQRHGKSVMRREGERSLGKDIKETASAIAEMGWSALADLRHRQAQGVEYVLHDDFFEIVEGGTVKSIRYKDVLALKVRGDVGTLVFERGSMDIRPQAHIVSGRIKVPVGWSRNGMEVPFGLILDELGARCGVRVDIES